MRRWALRAARARKRYADRLWVISAPTRQRLYASYRQRILGRARRADARWARREAARLSGRRPGRRPIALATALGLAVVAATTAAGLSGPDDGQDPRVRHASVSEPSPATASRREPRAKTPERRRERRAQRPSNRRPGPAAAAMSDGETIAAEQTDQPVVSPRTVSGGAAPRREPLGMLDAPAKPRAPRRDRPAVDGPAPTPTTPTAPEPVAPAPAIEPPRGGGGNGPPVDHPGRGGPKPKDRN